MQKEDETAALIIAETEGLIAAVLHLKNENEELRERIKRQDREYEHIFNAVVQWERVYGALLPYVKNAFKLTERTVEQECKAEEKES